MLIIITLLHVHKIPINHKEHEEKNVGARNVCYYYDIIIQKEWDQIIFFIQIYGKNGFAEISKNLARYKSESNCT